jgi:hypothetical protein
MLCDILGIVFAQDPLNLTNEDVHVFSKIWGFSGSISINKLSYSFYSSSESP